MFEPPPVNIAEGYLVPFGLIFFSGWDLLGGKSEVGSVGLLNSSAYLDDCASVLNYRLTYTNISAGDQRFWSVFSTAGEGEIRLPT